MGDMEEAAMRKLLWTVFVLFAAGCVRVDVLPYCGSQEWPTGSAFVRPVDGMDVFEGLPDRPYKVLGLIDIHSSKPFYRSDYTRKKVLELAEEHEADALISLSDRTLSSGFFKVGSQEEGAAVVDSGRSTQPEMIITRVSQYVTTSSKKQLRTTVLMIQWKTPGRQAEAE
jgi:hypothetical protein